MQIFRHRTASLSLSFPLAADSIAAAIRDDSFQIYDGRTERLFIESCIFLLNQSVRGMGGIRITYLRLCEFIRV